MLYSANGRTTRVKSQTRKGQSDTLLPPGILDKLITIKQHISCSLSLYTRSFKIIQINQSRNIRSTLIPQRNIVNNILHDQKQ
jgi:hypothetical protein